MSSKGAWAATAALALAVPAMVFAGGSDDPLFTSLATSGGLTIQSTGPTGTNSTEYRRVGGLSRWDDSEMDYDGRSVFHVSVDLRAGKAKLRLREGESGDSVAISPSSVLVAGRGVSTASFHLNDETDTINDPIIEWKRSGQGPVKAASVAFDVVGPLD